MRKKPAVIHILAVERGILHHHVIASPVLSEGRQVCFKGVTAGTFPITTWLRSGVSCIGNRGIINAIPRLTQAKETMREWALWGKYHKFLTLELFIYKTKMG